VLRAVISKDGSIENLSLVSGHPMLAPAAIEAVKQWKYKPYLLNGEPVKWILKYKSTSLWPEARLGRVRDCVSGL